MQFRSFRHTSFLAAALAVLAACGETGPSEQLPPAAITNVTGVTLTGPAGEALPERIVVQVMDASGSPLPGVQVSFTAGSGGSAAPASAITDLDGEARTRWTLGLTTGEQVLAVTAGGTTTNITATAAAPRIASLAVNAGNNQTGTSGNALATNPSVIVKNAAGAPVAGVTVFFTVMTGGGTVASPSGVSDAQGIATAGAWVLGPVGGTQLLSAQVPQSGVTNNPLIFAATAAAGAPASVVAVSLTQQSAPVGTLVASPPSVVVRDASGIAVPNASVTFAITSGGGQLQGATQTTNAQGVATVTSWRLGNAPGANTVTATVAGLPPVTFTATATAGAPTQVQKTAGDNQTAPVNRPVPVAPTVRVLDAGGNGVAGLTVNFAVASGGGAVVVNSVTTGADGSAAVGAWILGPTQGTNTLTATVGNLTPVTFTATGTGGTAVSMQPVSQVTQTGLAGAAATSPPSVVVRDALGNPVQGIQVTFAVTAGSGTLQGAVQNTNANGIATVTSWTFGPVAGTNTVVASATGLTSVTFNATTTGVPTAMVAFSGDNQAAVQGTALPNPPRVRITDANGQGVPNVLVTFAVTSGGGNMENATQPTDATGVASAGTWTLGTTGTQTLTATAAPGGITGNPVVFNASAATQIVVTQQPPANAGSGTNFTVTVQLRNSGNSLSPVTGLPLTISLASGGGTLAAGGTALTVNTTAGVASFN